MEDIVMLARIQIVVVLALVLPLLWIGPVYGQTAPAAAPNREAAIVDSSTEVLGQIMSIPGKGIPESLLSKAEGIVIVPDMIKGGFIVGVRHGRGVIVTRDEAGKWKAPMFVEITGGSIGWQVGVQGTDLVLVFRTKNSLQNLMRGKFTIGATASAAAGPVGREAQAATDVALKAEILSYSRSRGLFAGVALDGAKLSIDNASTTAYYQPAAYGYMQPNQPPPMPSSAGRLLQEIAKYTTVAPGAPAPAAGQPVAADPRALRDRLAASWRELATVLDSSWQTYLALPAEVYSGDRLPSAESLRPVLDRFATVAADSRYQALTQQPKFQATWSLLRQYCDTVSHTAAAQPLPLPPPPR
jgi:SH3 domain-containing YSC84-like protein 1